MTQLAFDSLSNTSFLIIFHSFSFFFFSIWKQNIILNAPSWKELKNKVCINFKNYLNLKVFCKFDLCKYNQFFTYGSHLFVEVALLTEYEEWKNSFWLCFQRNWMKSWNKIVKSMILKLMRNIFEWFRRKWFFEELKKSNYFRLNKS